MDFIHAALNHPDREINKSLNLKRFLCSIIRRLSQKSLGQTRKVQSVLSAKVAHNEYNIFSF